MMSVSAKRLLITVFTALVLTVGGAGAQSQQLALRSTDGQTVNLADFRGKVVVLSFSATWAPLVSKELPAVQRLADRYTTRGVVVYWVSINSLKQGAKNYASDADLQAFARRYGLKVPVLRDPEQGVYSALGLTALPTIVVVDPSGGIAHRHVGFDPGPGDSLEDVSKAIDQLLK